MVLKGKSVMLTRGPTNNSIFGLYNSCALYFLFPLPLFFPSDEAHINVCSLYFLFSAQRGTHTHTTNCVSLCYFFLFAVWQLLIIDTDRLPPLLHLLQLALVTLLWSLRLFTSSSLSSLSMCRRSLSKQK